MNEPKRIQRKRTKGWRMPEGAVYVGAVVAALVESEPIRALLAEHEAANDWRFADDPLTVHRLLGAVAVVDRYLTPKTTK